jgi:peptidoglycan/LPS O-acetylase OafA/YrhL
LFLIFLLVKGVYVPYVHNQVYATLFGILILNLAANKKRIFSLEYKPLDYLGKISYGIYMYHPLAIAIALKILMNTGENYLLWQILLSLILTVIVSSISYQFLEKPFIRRKVKFSKIITGDNVDPE